MKKFLLITLSFIFTLNVYSQSGNFCDDFETYIKQISLDNYGKGIYFLEIETITGVVNKKLVLQ